MAIEIIQIPDLGEAEEVEVIELSAKVGDDVGPDDPIIVLESDKAAMEIPASCAGKIVAIKVNVGDSVSAGMAFLEIEVESQIVEQVSSEAETQTLPNTQEKTVSKITPPALDQKTINDHPSMPSGASVYAGPAVRKLAREFGIQLSLISPTGPKGRIQKEDLHIFVQAKLSGESTSAKFQFTQPTVDYSKWGDVEEQSLTKFQKSSITNLHTSWINIPHVTQHDECNLSPLMDLRARLNILHEVKVSPLAFISKITAQVLFEFPLLNSSLSPNLDSIIKKGYVNLGIAVDTPEGLIVPNIKNTQDKSILAIAEEIKFLANAAKTRKLKLEDLKGASFSISSLGAVGGKFFTPIINPPEVGILGLSKAFQKVVPEGSGFKAIECLPLSLSYDHRAINGVYAAQFISDLGLALSDVSLIEESFK